jgi:hypothetical protein
MSRMWEAYNMPQALEWTQVFDSAKDAPPPVIRPTVPRVRTVRAQPVGNAAPGTINPPGSVRLRRQGASTEYVCPRRDDKPLDEVHDLLGVEYFTPKPELEAAFGPRPRHPELHPSRNEAVPVLSRPADSQSW